MIKIFVADDHPIVREDLKRILNESANFYIVGEASNGNDTLKKIESSGADILLLDISMPGPGFLEILQRVKKYNLNLHVLILSAHDEDQYALRSIKAGASGYLTKEQSSEELTKAINKIFSGRKYISEALAEKLAFDIENNLPEDIHERLSNREY